MQSYETDWFHCLAAAKSGDLISYLLLDAQNFYRVIEIDNSSSTIIEKASVFQIPGVANFDLYEQGMRADFNSVNGVF